MQKASALCRVRHKTHIERIGGRETLLHPDMRSKNFITHLAPTSGILLSAGASSSHRSVVHSRRRSAQRCFQVLDLRHSHIFPSFFFWMHRLLLFFVFRVCYICLCLLAAPSRFSSAAWTRGARLPGMLTSDALSYGVGYLFPLRPITWICKQACAQGVAWGGGSLGAFSEKSGRVPPPRPPSR